MSDLFENLKMLEQNGLEENSEEDEGSKPVLAMPMGEKKIPFLLEFFISLTKVLVLGAGILVAVLSAINKATFLDILLRTSLTLVVMGLFGVLLNYVIGRNFVQAAVVELQELAEEQEEANSEEFEE